jgi:hypothetical protein
MRRAGNKTPEEKEKYYRLIPLWAKRVRRKIRFIEKETADPGFPDDSFRKFLDRRLDKKGQAAKSPYMRPDPKGY